MDEVIPISDAVSFGTARRVTREEGLLIGGSGGTAVAAALKVGAGLPPDAVIVVHIPDSGRGYLSKLYDDGWMADHGFLRAAGPTVGDLLRGRDPSLPALVHTHPDETVRTAIEILREFEVSQMPVVKHEPPVVLAEVIGAVSERELLQVSVADPGALDKPVGEVMGPPLPTVGIGEPIDVAIERLETASAALVLDGGHPVGVHHALRRARCSCRPAALLMVDLDGKGFGTRAVHGAGAPDPATGAVVPPISLATTFRQEAVGHHAGYEYTRSGNPTRTALETHLAALEGAAPRVRVRVGPGR